MWVILLYVQQNDVNYLFYEIMFNLFYKMMFYNMILKMTGHYHWITTGSLFKLRVKQDKMPGHVYAFNQIID